jgi:hypothetical protein
MPGSKTKVRRTIRKQKNKVTRDATLLRGIKQGVGMVTKTPFGKGRSTGFRKARPGKVASRNKLSNRRSALCALNNLHLPLPRAVGAYTVSKTTTIISTDREIMTFGCLKGNRVNYTDSAWLDVVAVSYGGDPGITNAINATNNATFWKDSALSSSGFEHCRLVPSAITVQIMCPKNLQNADGIAYIGRTKQVLDLMGNTRTWETLSTELVSFSAPRLCSAGKLALRGVKVDAIPYNMNQLSDFSPRGLVSASDVHPSTVTWNEGTFEANFEGFAPIFVYNPNSIYLQYLVTIEWRTRFDPGNPAYSGHVYHPVASESCWNDTVKGMEQEGHGVYDIAEGVADFGDAGFALL